MCVWHAMGDSGRQVWVVQCTYLYKSIENRFSFVYLKFQGIFLCTRFSRDKVSRRLSFLSPCWSAGFPTATSITYLFVYIKMPIKYFDCYYDVNVNLPLNFYMHEFHSQNTSLQLSRFCNFLCFTYQLKTYLSILFVIFFLFHFMNLIFIFYYKTFR